MPKLELISVFSLACVLACVPSPVKKADPGSIDVMTTGTGGTNGSGEAGAAGTGDDDASAPADASGAAGTAGATGDAGATDVAGASGTAGATGAAGDPGAGGTDPMGAAGNAGAAGTMSATGGAGAAGMVGGTDAGVSTMPEAPVITDPCDHRTWTFTPSVICTTACGTMPDTAKLPANAIDGDTTTRYTTGITQGSRGPEVVILTFPQNVSLTGLNLLSKNGDGPISYLVESSLDGANFSYFTPSAAGAGSDNLTVTFPAPTTLRAVRITQTGVKKTNWWSIWELTVKGCAAVP
jgi:hypothetical protein